MAVLVKLRHSETDRTRGTILASPPDMPRQTVKFLVFGASLRSDALNHRLAQLAGRIVEKQGGTVDLARMADFDAPPYDGDVERDAGLPDPAKEFCRRLQACDAFLIASPEYNASMP